jgi:hypothetical protein
MSLLQEMEKFGFADCEQNRAYINSRLFMIQDIVTMGSWHPDRLEVFDTMSDEGRYTLWLDLMNLTMKESIQYEDV